MTPGRSSKWHLLRRLPVQLNLILTALLVTTLALFGAYTADRQGEFAQDSLRKQLVVLASNTASASIEPLITRDLTGVENYLLRIAEFPGTRIVQVSNRANQIVGLVEVAPAVGPFVSYDAKPVAPPPTPSVIHDKEAQELQVWQPIEHGERLGWVYLCVGTESIKAIKAQILRSTLVAVLLVILANLLLIWAFLRRSLGTLAVATAFAGALTQRHGGQLAVTRGTHELEQLQQALNETSLTLHTQDTQIAETLQALRNSEQRTSDLITHAPDGIITLDRDGRIHSANPAAQALCGLPLAALIGKPCVQAGVLSDNSKQALAAALQVLPEGRPVKPLELELRQPDGRLVHVVAQLKHRGEAGEPGEAQVMLHDITERRRLEALTARLGRVLDASASEISVFNAQTLHLMQVNEGAQKNLGYSLDELLTMTPVDLEPQTSRKSFESRLAPLRYGEAEVLVFETEYQRKDGTSYPVEVRLQLSHTETPPVFVAVAQDISERRKTEERLQFLANYDALTGLPNRPHLVERLAQACAEANRYERLVGVLFMDLDNFKNVNDTLGHEAGDVLLKHVAHELAATLRPGDTVARLGGDEFLVLLANVAHVDDITAITEKIRARLARPVNVGGHELSTSVSIGITVYPFDDATGDKLLKYADTAMYHAKARGRNNYQFYTADLNARIERRVALEQGLRVALERGELELHYQPQIGLDRGMLIGAEALLRWRHPQWGLVSPMDFIPVAEATGLIVPIGEWVLQTACREARAWREAGYGPLKVAVNLSSRQFEDNDLAGRVAQTLARCGLSAEQLDLEITESLIIENLDEVTKVLKQLSESGVTISMDDFGTGYSSLSHLKRLPIDVLKIDRSFVRDLPQDADDSALARTIISMAHTLGIRVIAEGVETEAQRAFLQAHGCDAAQGYLIAKPMPAAELRDWFANHAGLPGKQDAGH